MPSKWAPGIPGLEVFQKDPEWMMEEGRLVTPFGDGGLLAPRVAVLRTDQPVCDHYTAPVCSPTKGISALRRNHDRPRYRCRGAPEE